jgi:hypothetical protein
MVDKSAGVDFDRNVFVHPQTPTIVPAATSRITGIVFALAVIAAVFFLGYKLVPQITRGSTGASDPAMADLDKRLALIEERLEKLESSRKTTVVVKKEEPGEAKETAPARPMVKTVYQVSPTSRLQARTGSVPTLAQDPATTQRFAALQQSLGTLQSDQVATREAWQATTDKLADMAGQVGTQGVEILRSQDELNQLLTRTEMEPIPFELMRGSNPQPVGPVSLVLKSTNPKTQRYSVCVYIQPSCIELKDRTLHEVVQFVTARNTIPLEVIATKIVKDEIVGYLEVPRNQSGH